MATLADAVPTQRATGSETQVAPLGVAKEGIAAIDSLGLGNRQLRPALRRIVEAVPRVAAQDERLGGRGGADVDRHGHLLGPEGDEVVVEPPVAAGRELRRRGLLEDPQAPLPGPIDG